MGKKTDRLVRIQKIQSNQIVELRNTVTKIENHQAVMDAFLADRKAGFDYLARRCADLIQERDEARASLARLRASIHIAQGVSDLAACHRLLKSALDKNRSDVNE